MKVYSYWKTLIVKETGSSGDSETQKIVFESSVYDQAGEKITLFLDSAAIPEFINSLEKYLIPALKGDYQRFIAFKKKEER